MLQCEDNVPVLRGGKCMLQTLQIYRNYNSTMKFETSVCVCVEDKGGNVVCALEATALCIQLLGLERSAGIKHRIFFILFFPYIKEGEAKNQRLCQSGDKYLSLLCPPSLYLHTHTHTQVSELQH